MRFILFFLLGVPTVAFGIECKWWQVKVSTHQIKKHQRNGSSVAAHLRHTHCREKWKGADTLIGRISDAPVVGWDKRESFKNWSQRDMAILLENLSSLPDWSKTSDYTYKRATKSILQNNPATSEITHGIIVLYDLFFTSQNKRSILVHESGHHLYKFLGVSGINEFVMLSGWTEEVSDVGRMYEIPPKKVILEDSKIGKDEDFSNHLEKYFEDPEKYKTQFPVLFKFFNMRYPL